MTFLQPFILWGLPLVLLPIIIHLLNRMRHRPQPWAAMRFLVSATRSSVNNARLKQWLILALRVLAVLMLVLFVSRPLAGGWLGWALSPAPDAVLILLDRSASMETRTTGATVTRREQALRSLAQAAEEFQESSHLLLIDSATRAPHEIRRASTLLDPLLTGPTDTAADIPGLLNTALTWLIENRAGTTELWIASDLQASNWQADDSRWPALITQFQALPQRVKIRLLALDQPGEFNRSVSLKEMVRRPRGQESELQFAVDLQESVRKAEAFPLAFNLDGARTQKELTLDGQTFRWRHSVKLDRKAGSGWGSFELPADGNPRDNTAYFVYSPETALHATIVGSDTRSARLLQLALNAAGRTNRPVAEIVPTANAAQANWQDSTLLVWQDLSPSGAVAQKVRAFVEEGGTVLFFPPGRPEPQPFEGVTWGETQTTTADRPFRVLRWNEEDGPLAKSDEGLSLPLTYAQFSRRQSIQGAKNILAAFDDGTPLLARQTLGRGEIYYCASSPERDWSSLGEGPVLVPMLQRLLQSGARRLLQATAINCGELSAVDRGRRWEPVDSASPKDILAHAGVYRSGDRLLAVNCPRAEEDPEVLDASAVRRMFGALGVQMLQERRGQAENLQGEIWRLFLFAMLVFLVVEGALILPPRSGLAGARLSPGAPRSNASSGASL
jgi:hypothetical protein